MNCTNCKQFIDQHRNGFIVCPYCGTVNIPPAKTKTVKKTQPTESSVKIARAKKPNSQLFKFITSNLKSKRSKLIVFGSAGLLILSGLVIFGYLYYQDSQARAQLAQAKIKINSQNYEDALTILERAKNHKSFSSTRKKIVDLENEDKNWIKDSATLAKVRALIIQNKLEEAAALLDNFDKTFPAYKQTVVLKNSIESLLASAVTPVIPPPTVAAPTAPATPPAATSQPNTPPPSPPPPTPPAAAGAKRFTSTAALSSLASATTLPAAQQAMQSFLSQYNLTAHITSFAPSSYASTYDGFLQLNSFDLPALKAYGALLIDEWAKYPTDWVANSKLKSINFVKNFSTGGKLQPGGPDPFGQAMYYDVSYSGDNARESIHHEYSHLVTYNRYGLYQPGDTAWQNLNLTGFTYGSGGSYCYVKSASCLNNAHPVPGFVTGFATTNMAEDKAEIFGYLMEGTYYHQLKTWMTTDTNLKNKVNSYKSFISSQSGTMAGSYFDDIDP